MRWPSSQADQPLAQPVETAIDHLAVTVAAE